MVSICPEDCRVTNAAAAADNATSSTATVEQRLVRRLLRHYDVDARGVSNVKLMLLRIQQLVGRRKYGKCFILHINVRHLIVVCVPYKMMCSLYRDRNIVRHDC